MEKIREHIYLAALLHDIGKFYQRADTGSVKTSQFLKTYCKDENTFCPKNKDGFYTHKHVLWTAQFIDDNRSVFKTLTGNNIEDLKDDNNLIRLSSSHHLSNNQLSDFGKIIKEADCLSSGMDRESESSFKDDQDENNWDAFKRKRMASILETIQRKEYCIKYHIPVKAIQLNKDVFPKENFTEDPDYSTLWNQFIAEFKFIQANTYHAFTETLLNLLYKYSTCIPASTINFPDVSLYDHLKTTAALAVCLYDVKQSEEKPKNPFLLIGADFSGIQSYIYQIVSKYAGKNLKGRSFYLRLLSDSVVRYLLKKLNLYQANIVYNSGGGFYLIAPNTAFVRESLESAIKEIEQHLFSTHQTSLFVAIDSIEVSKEALMHKNGENLGVVWGELFKKRDKKKSCKFSSQINSNYSIFFEPSAQGGDAKRDSITGEEFIPNEKVMEEDKLLLKKTTSDQIKLGKVLRDTEVMAVSDGEIPYWKDKTPINPAGLGFFYYFIKKDEAEQLKKQLRSSADKVTVVTLNGENGNCDFIGNVDINGINNIYSLEFYGGNEFNGNTFEKMCENPGFSRLGVLRMDVDNLGNIFQTGIDKDRATLSRYAALSRSFDYFFSGYLNTIWKELNPEHSFIIYSGGDDLFIVGSWDSTIQIADQIHKDFGEFTCHNTAFSISGGIAIVPAKFPIMKGADESDREEKKAKVHKCKGVNKNSISIMETPLNWNNEFFKVKELKDEIVRLVKIDSVAKSFISKILAHAVNAKIKEHKITAVKTIWMMAYDLSRMIVRKADTDAKSLINKCKSEVCSNKKILNGQPIETDYHPLELWAFACRWAELELRTE